MKQSPRKPKQSQATRRGQSATFWIKPEDFVRLKHHAAAAGVSMSSVINRALRRYLDDQHGQFPQN